MMTLDEALHYIHAVCWKGSIPGLERITALLDAMGHPERKCKFVHVAGTNGKGSTCAMLASIFQAAGYKTGLYTSPFIVEFGERIQVNGQMISNDDICALTEYVKPFAESIFEQPTEFEMVTAIGFEYFARQQCDIVVCEVGMGGEFDATNVILPPEVAILCNIGLDHTEVLGDTLEKIAATKSVIIKPGCNAVIYREQPSVEAVFEERCKKVGAKLHKANFDSIRLRSHGLEGQVFDCDGYEALELPLLGDKDFHCMYANVAPFAKEFITVTPGNPRALDAKDLAKYLATFGKPVTPCETVADGVKLAVEHAGKDGVVLCYGSLYMLGDVKAAVAAL